jgi:hypothetical protein
LHARALLLTRISSPCRSLTTSKRYRRPSPAPLRLLGDDSDDLCFPLSLLEPFSLTEFPNSPNSPLCSFSLSDRLENRAHFLQQMGKPSSDELKQQEVSSLTPVQVETPKARRANFHTPLFLNRR